MKKTVIAIIAFVCGAVFAACSEKLGAEEPKCMFDSNVLKEAIYNYQLIMDCYVSDDLWGDVIAEGDEWWEICDAIGSPYEPEPSQFWDEYPSDPKHYHNHHEDNL